MRLRRSDPKSVGIRRVRRGRGFAFVGPDGRAVDSETRERARALVIPPAWQHVWVCPWPNGHIQAIGTDEAGRRQYLYHPQWNASRGRIKHDRVVELARQLPDVRREVERRLRQQGVGRDRVAAVALRILDAGLFRTGGEEYEHDHGTHGVATLLRDHVRVSGDVVSFAFPAKSGVEREAQVRDNLLAKAVGSLKRSRPPGDRLLQWHDDEGWHDLTSSDVNAAFRELAGDHYTVKDLRTWAATVLAACALAAAESESVAENVAEREAVRLVAEHLGNTPAVARRSYVDPRVTDEYAAGRTIARTLSRASAADRARLQRGDLADVKQRNALERAVIRLLR